MINVNPGYLAFLVMTISVVLLASGWKTILLRGFSDRNILLFFVLWVGIGSFSFTLAGVEVHLDLVVLAVSALATAASRRSQPLVLAHIGVSALLLGVLGFVLEELEGSVPWLPSRHPLIERSLFLATVAVMMSREPVIQFASTGLALCLAETFGVFVRPYMGMGGWEFQDQVWLTLFAARIGAVTLETSLKLALQVGRRIRKD